MAFEEKRKGKSFFKVMILKAAHKTYRREFLVQSTHNKCFRPKQREAIEVTVRNRMT